MGCTPSIHVSQTGVVYCPDSEESNSPRPSSLSAQAQTLRTDILEGGGTSSSTPGAGKSSYKAVERRGTISISEAETQTSRPAMKTSDNNINFGLMRLKQQTMSILLVFAKEDSQSDGFWWAAERAGYKCNIARNAEGALECYLDKHHDLVIIDHRHSKYFDAEALCRSIRATKHNEHTVIVAVTKKVPNDKEEPSLLPLLTAGFNRRFLENANVSVCQNELLIIEHNDVQNQLKLQGVKSLFTALENVDEAVEITNADHEIQYINPGYERLMGYTSEDVIGKDEQELPRSERNKPDLQETINSQLKKGKHWEGTCYSRRKNGENIAINCHISPVSGQAGKICHYVSIKSAVQENQQLERFKDTEINQINDQLGYHHIDTVRSLRKGSYDVRSLSICSEGGVHSYRGRRESVARIHSMTIEAPITKVINIINAAQQNSPLTVVEALDRVLEILRQTDLYSPNLNPHQVKEDDQMTTDLVGGLMTMQGLKRRSSSTDITYHKQQQNHHHIPSPSVDIIPQVPDEIEASLVNFSSWDFHVIDLEKVSNQRPLYYLGRKIFARFGLMEVLNISESVVCNWLQLIEANYHSSNSYHNSTHACDVLHATAYFLEREKIKATFDPLDEVASLIAAAVHDVDHPGRTNSFLVNAGNELAILYNDLAVLECHHSSLAFQLSTRDDRVNIFKNLDRDDNKAMRQTVIDMVLATEMTKHFEHLNKFVSNVNKIVNRGDDDGGSSVVSGRGTPDSSSTASALTTPENRMLIKRMLIKCADISNPVRPLELCIEWANRIAEEYFSQTDEEKDRGLPVVMPVFDRKTCSIPKSQTSFVDFFINDMFDAWDAFCDIPDLMTHLQNNYKFWKEKEEHQALEKEEKAEANKDA